MQRFISFFSKDLSRAGVVLLMGIAVFALPSWGLNEGDQVSIIGDETTGDLHALEGEDGVVTDGGLVVVESESLPTARTGAQPRAMMKTRKSPRMRVAARSEETRPEK